MTEGGATHDGIGVDGLARMLRDGRITRRGFLARAAGLLGSAAVAEGMLARVAAGQTTTKTDLVIAQNADVGKLDPHFSTAVHAITISFNMFDHLVSRHRDGKLAPSLATEDRKSVE